MERVPRQPRAAVEHSRRRGRQNVSHFPNVGLDQKPAPLRHVPLHAVAVLETVAQLPQRVHVADRSGSGAKRHAGSQIPSAVAAVDDRCTVSFRVYTIRHRTKGRYDVLGVLMYGQRR
nr:hypothetical protein Iba_chr11aCG18130 [Ipomoea batatas]